MSELLAQRLRKQRENILQVKSHLKEMNRLNKHRRWTLELAKSAVERRLHMIMNQNHMKPELKEIDFVSID